MKIFPRKFKFLAFLLVFSMLLGAFATVALAKDAPLSDFCSAVESIKSAATLSQKERFVALAGERWEAYVRAGGSSDDEEASEAYAYYIEAKGEVDALTALCREFIEYVILASDAWSLVNYTAAKEQLSYAEAIYDSVDKGYEGVSGAVSTYSALSTEIANCEKPYLLYIENIEKAAEAVTYEDIFGYLEVAEMALRDIKKQAIKINSFPGFAEAEEKCVLVEYVLNDIMGAAVEFLDAVRGIALDTIKADVAEAYEIYERIDATADGVAAAKRELDARVSEFNDNAERSNAMVDDAHSMIFALML